MPPASLDLLPLLLSIILAIWPEAPLYSAFGGQVEQETCPSLSHSKCWSPKAELKTSREYGFGLGQITVTSRFNKFSELRAQHRELIDWLWEDRYDARMQLQALVLMDKRIYYSIDDAHDSFERLAMTLSAYNGGEGGLRRDRLLCDATENCDSSKWFGHTEKHSWRAKTSVQGYGKSFFEINREYVYNILFKRRQKYVPALGE